VPSAKISTVSLVFSLFNPAWALGLAVHSSKIYVALRFLEFATTFTTGQPMMHSRFWRSGIPVEAKSHLYE